MKWPWSRDNSRLPTSVKDVSELEKPGDPRGGLQDETYRRADPRDVVEAEGTAMSGPGGAPQQETTPEERRASDR